MSPEPGDLTGPAHRDWLLRRNFHFCKGRNVFLHRIAQEQLACSTNIIAATEVIGLFME
jgi:hypothetical protein